MILPKGGMNWKSARARLPPWKAVFVFLTRTRLLVSVALTGLIVLLWRGIFVSTKEMSKYAPWDFRGRPGLTVIQFLLLWACETAHRHEH